MHPVSASQSSCFCSYESTSPHLSTLSQDDVSSHPVSFKHFEQFRLSSCQAVHALILPLRILPGLYDWISSSSDSQQCPIEHQMAESYPRSQPTQFTIPMRRNIAEPVDAGWFHGASGLRPLVTARVIRAWRFSASRSSSARFFSISPSMRAVFSSRNRAIRRWVSSGAKGSRLMSYRSPNLRGASSHRRFGADQCP